MFGNIAKTTADKEKPGPSPGATAATNYLALLFSNMNRSRHSALVRTTASSAHRMTAQHTKQNVGRCTRKPTESHPPAPIMHAATAAN